MNLGFNHYAKAPGDFGLSQAAMAMGFSFVVRGVELGHDRQAQSSESLGASRNQSALCNLIKEKI